MCRLEVLYYCLPSARLDEPDCFGSGLKVTFKPKQNVFHLCKLHQSKTSGISISFEAIEDTDIKSF
jgi:hypothetical protein